MKKKKELDRRMFKKSGEELQQWLTFKKRGSKADDKSKYHRHQKHKGKEMD